MFKHWAASMLETFRIQGEVEALRAFYLSNDGKELLATNPLYDEPFLLEEATEWFDAKAFQAVGGSA